MILTVENLSKSYGEKILFENINFTIDNGDKIGLVGVNGTGKSTFIKTIAGVITPDYGSMIKARGLQIESLLQDAELEPDNTVLMEVFKGNQPIMKVLAQYEQALKVSETENNKLLQDEVLKLSQEIDKLDGWKIESDAKIVLTKLGITDFSQKIKNLSGGQKKRVALAASLINICDLLILDELDAFPFVGNEVLQAIANQACIGQKLMLSATPDKESMELVKQKKIELVCLFERPHKHPLIVPKVIQVSILIQVWIVIYLCIKFQKEGKQTLVFVPRKNDGKWMKMILNVFVKTDFIHSSTQNKDEILDCFRNKELSALVCTTLLERGITIPSVQVVVFKGDHSVFTTASLIQIFGRVGRSFKDPEGKGVCLCQASSESIKDCVSQITKMNDTVYVATKK